VSDQIATTDICRRLTKALRQVSAGTSCRVGALRQRRRRLFPAFSDLDVAVFLRGSYSLEEAIAVQCSLDVVEIAPFDYLQTRYLDVDDAPSAALVPGGFSFCLR
jgi:hypothetical protein